MQKLKVFLQRKTACLHEGPSWRPEPIIVWMGMVNNLNSACGNGRTKCGNNYAINYDVLMMECNMS